MKREEKAAASDFTEATSDKSLPQSKGMVDLSAVAMGRTGGEGGWGMVREEKYDPTLLLCEVALRYVARTLK